MDGWMEIMIFKKRDRYSDVLMSTLHLYNVKHDSSGLSIECCSQLKDQFARLPFRDSYKYTQAL